MTEVRTGQAFSFYHRVSAIVVTAALLCVAALFTFRTSPRKFTPIAEPWEVVRASLDRESDACWPLYQTDQLPDGIWHMPVADPVERDPLSKEALAILRDGLRDATQVNATVQQQNLEILDRMTDLRWPRLADLKRVRVAEPRQSTDTPHRGWLLDEMETQVRLLTDGFQIEHVYKGEPAEIEPHTQPVAPADFQKDLQEFLARVAKQDPPEDRWDFDRELGLGILDHGLQLRLFDWSVAAAQFGYRDEARAALRELLRMAPGGLADLQDEFVAAHLDRAARELAENSGLQNTVHDDDADWREFAELCRELREIYPECKARPRLDAFINGIEADLSRPRPAWLSKPRYQLTQDETIRLLIHQFRDHRFSEITCWGPYLFDDDSPAQRLVLIGAPAISILVDSLSDMAPCRTNDYNRHTLDASNLFRRQDLVFECLERITGCQFFAKHTLEEVPSFQRDAAVSRARDWWRLCQGQSQAGMIRAWLTTIPDEDSLRWYERSDGEDRRRAIVLLAHLEGPDAFLDELQAVPRHPNRRGEPPDYEQFVPSQPGRQALIRLHDRFKRSSLTLRNIDELLKYGSRYNYRELARAVIEEESISDSEEPGKKRFTADVPRKRPGILFNPGHVELAVKFGQNWSIPLLFALLRNSADGNVDVRSGMTTADHAMAALIQLTGRDFGYDASAPLAERIAVFDSARAWEDKASWKELWQLVDRDHPQVHANCDLFLSEERVAEVARAISEGSAEQRREAIARLGDVYTWQIQRALLGALRHEPAPEHRLRMLELVSWSPQIWHAPDLTRIFEHDPSLDCRIRAARLLVEILKSPLHEIPHSGVRIETLERTVEAGRRIAADELAPQQLRDIAFELLIGWRSPLDKPLLERLDRQPGFQHRYLIDEFSEVLGENYSGENLLDDLIRGLSHEEWNYRARAVVALGQFGPEAAAALPQLLEILDSDVDEDHWAQQAVFTALTSIRAPGTAGALMERIRDPRRSLAKRDAAVTALTQFDHGNLPPIVADYLIEALRGDDVERAIWGAKLLACHASRSVPFLPQLRQRFEGSRGELRAVLRRTIRAIESAHERRS